MFENDMVERRTNVVNIEDLDPEVVAEMLQFIHTGRTPNINELAKGSLKTGKNNGTTKSKNPFPPTLTAEKLSSSTSMKCPSGPSMSGQVLSGRVRTIQSSFMDMELTPPTTKTF